MRKALLILLLAVLPIQFVWGAGASYCQHEQGVEASHFGHHTHKHAGKVTKTSDMSAEKSQQAGGDDADCVACHMSGASVISDEPLAPRAVQVTEGVPTVRTSHSRLLVSSIDRPNWVALT